MLNTDSHVASSASTAIVLHRHGVTTPSFNQDCRTLGKLHNTEKTWVYLQVPTAAVTQTLLDKIDDKDPMAIDDMLTFHFRVTKHDKTIKDRHHPLVLAFTLVQRDKQLNRLAGWFADCIEESDGTVKYGARPLLFFSFHIDVCRLFSMVG